MPQNLHIINFTVPYPPNYGGVIDLFWKLPALQKQGVQIHLHCFDYGRGEQKELNKYCASVQYYKRKNGWQGVNFSLPYIVSSRKNETLFENLLKDDFPILLEGVHSCYLLNDKRFAKRRKIVRLHNVEHHYYEDLAAKANSFFKKLYYQWESKQLKKFELAMKSYAYDFYTVTEKDAIFFEEDFGFNNVHFLPLFLPEHWQVNVKTGIGSYCLYQADLSVAANEKAALWLLKDVFNDLPFQLIIAGKNPSKQLLEMASSNQQCSIKANPTETEMQELIAHAQINILPSFSNTGIKLKLINALYNGKHCLVNDATVDGTNLNKLCVVANSSQEMKNTIQQLMLVEIDGNSIQKRKEILQSIFNNDENAKKLLEYCF